MPRFDLSYLLGGFIVLSCMFFLHILSVEIEVLNKEDAPNFFTFVPDLSFSYSCPPTDDNESDYFQFYQPFFMWHGFDTRGSPQDFGAIDAKRRMISFYVTLNDGVEHHAELSSEPPTIHDPALEQDILAFVSNTLKCNVTNLQRQTNARRAKMAYDRIFQENLWRYQPAK